MLQFYVGLCCIESNVAHKVRRYIHLFVAPDLVSDIKGIISKINHIASTNIQLIHLRRISASPSVSWGVSSRRIFMKLLTDQHYEH